MSLEVYDEYGQVLLSPSTFLPGGQGYNIQNMEAVYLNASFIAFDYLHPTTYVRTRCNSVHMLPSDFSIVKKLSLFKLVDGLNSSIFTNLIAGFYGVSNYGTTAGTTRCIQIDGDLNRLSSNKEGLLNVYDESGLVWSNNSIQLGAFLVGIFTFDISTLPVKSNLTYTIPEQYDPECIYLRPFIPGEFYVNIIDASNSTPVFQLQRSGRTYTIRPTTYGTSTSVSGTLASNFGSNFFQLLVIYIPSAK